MADPEAIAPEDELLLHTKHTLPHNVKRYWQKRYLLFSRFDEGVYMLLELWYSVTPEAVAQFTAKLISELLGGRGVIVDVCCGGGGNTIQFARYFDRVVAIDVNPVNITCTAHNCQVYGVADKVELVTGDWFQLSQQKLVGNDGNVSFMFCLPPWGGTEYTRTENGFDVDKMTPFQLPWLVDSLLSHALSCGVFLPRNSNMAQLEQLLVKYNLRVVYLYLDNHCVGLLALYGEICEFEWDYNDAFLESEEYEEGEENDANGEENGDNGNYSKLSY